MFRAVSRVSERNGRHGTNHNNPTERDEETFANAVVLADSCLLQSYLGSSSDHSGNQ